MRNASDQSRRWEGVVDGNTDVRVPVVRRCLAPAAFGLFLFPGAALAPAAVAAQEPAVWQLVEDLRIGSIDDPETNLTRVGAVRIGPNGSMYVWQGQSRQMVVFDALGERSHKLGGYGAGPGEFVDNVVTWTWRGDTLAAFVRNQQRYSMFLADGTHIRTSRVLPEGSIGTVVLEWVLADGSVVGWPRKRAEEGESRPRLRYSQDGVLLDTLISPKPSGGGGGAEVRLSGNTIMTFPRPVMSSPLLVRDPLGRHLTVVERPTAEGPGTSTFRVVRVGLAGDTLFDRHYRYRPQPTHAEWVDSVRADYRARFSKPTPLGRTLGNDDITLLMDALDIPEFYPPVSEAVVGRDGSLWLRREQVGGGGWLVLNDRGMLVASVVGPATLEILNADGRTAWGVVHDDLDVPYLVRYTTRAR